MASPFRELNERVFLLAFIMYVVFSTCHFYHYEKPFNFYLWIIVAVPMLFYLCTLFYLSVSGRFAASKKSKIK